MIHRRGLKILFYFECPNCKNRTKIEKRKPERIAPPKRIAPSCKICNTLMEERELL